MYTFIRVHSKNAFASIYSCNIRLRMHLQHSQEINPPRQYLRFFLLEYLYLFGRNYLELDKLVELVRDALVASIVGLVEHIEL